MRVSTIWARAIMYDSQMIIAKSRRIAVPYGASLAGVVLSAVLAAPARAFYINPDISQTMGSHSYAGTDASVDFGGAFHVTPSYYDYHSDLSGDVEYKTYALRAAYDTSKFGLSIHGGYTPQPSGDHYSNRFLGVHGVLGFFPGTGKVQRLQQYHDASAAWQPWGWTPPPAGLSGFLVGAGIGYIGHKADVGGFGSPSTGSEAIGQTNLRADASAAFFDNLLSVDLTKSIYSGNLADKGLQPLSVEVLPGVNQEIQGFPEVSANFKLSMGMIPYVTPYIDYAHTTFDAGERPSGAYTAGCSVNLMMLSFRAYYERYVQIGQPDQNFVGLGAALNFQP